MSTEVTNDIIEQARQIPFLVAPESYTAAAVRYSTEKHLRFRSSQTQDTVGKCSKSHPPDEDIVTEVLRQ